MTPAVIVSGLTGGLAGAIVTTCFTLWREKRARKRAFRAYIKSLQWDLDVLMANWKHTDQGNPYFLFDWQKEAASKMAAPCTAILEDISAKSQERFIELLMQFSRHARRDSDPYKGKQPGQPLLYENKQRELNGMLQKVIEYAK